MTKHIQKQCPECGQQLRFPKDIGGMLMACPSCGKKFHSDFKIGGVRKHTKIHVVQDVFEMPSKVLDRITRFFSS
jgi:uncharacterized Zn finger protein